MPPTHSVAQAQAALGELAARWRGTTLNEKQAFQTWFHDFCDALGVGRPGPEGAGEYCFELHRPVVRPDGSDGSGYIDCWKAGHFALEAKASDTGTNEALLRRAYNQLLGYVRAEHGSIPPYLMVVDVPHELIIWDGWSGRFGGFAKGERVRLDSLHLRPDIVELLHDIFTNPANRDPRGRSQQVTRDIAGKLAQLSNVLEGRGHPPERVARFLMRCVFCFFAEDVELLPQGLFKRTLETAAAGGDADHVAAVLTALWQKMDQGGSFGADRIDRFNGHFFVRVESLPLEPGDVSLLTEAARFDWSAVEPSIFGTLLVRALDPVERHRLGAEYTPREYIERLVEPTVMEPLRERWSAVQARVVQLESDDAAKAVAVGATPRVAHSDRAKKPSKARREAIAEVQGFHAWLRGLRFLDPACGSGNFLYVTMAMVKELELEVIREIERLGAREGTAQVEQVLDEVHPRQFFGIEVSWWAREIAELTLWIGYHQFWRRHHGGRTPPTPILEDTGTIECRDAILAWDEIVHRPEKDRPDPTPRIVHHVTGELVPDPEARLPYMEYVGARQAEWPEADFIVGNPPYLGQARMRDALGDGYVDALRATYSSIPPSVDLVLYWWLKSAEAIASGGTCRAGLITTNSIIQPMNRRALQRTLDIGVAVVWAIPDHPWVQESDGAAVRVAMLVQGPPSGVARRGAVGDDGSITSVRTNALNADLSSTADVGTAATRGLLANEGLSHDGVKLHGGGFVLDRVEATTILASTPDSSQLVRPLLGGRDLAQHNQDRFVIDFGLMDEIEARQHPTLFDIVRSRVKPQRDVNRRKTYRIYWWRFGEPRRDWREASAALLRYIGTVDTSPHRYFTFIKAEVLVDDSIVQMALDQAWLLACLTCAIHLEWAHAAGGRLGVGNDPRYNKSRCFDPFPFPDPSPELRDKIGALAEKLDQHRKDALARDEAVTMTGMYNVVEKLRSGERLTPKEKKIHEIAACGVLKDLHDQLDALVAEAYGWPWPMEREEILERLVALHDERVEEEKRGHIRWLRPEYQIPKFAPDGTAPVAEELDLPAPAAAAKSPAERAQWPATAVEQIGLVQTLTARGLTDVDALVTAIDGADRRLVVRHLETLRMLGEVGE